MLLKHVNDYCMGHSHSQLKMQHLRVVDYQKLVVFPPEVDRNKLYYSLQTLRLSLRKVIVKVSNVEGFLFAHSREQFETGRWNAASCFFSF